MSKLFGFAIFLTGILIAQVVCPAPLESRRDIDNNTNQPESSENPGTEVETKEQEPVANESDTEPELEEYFEDEDDDDDSSEEVHEPSLPFLTCVLFRSDQPCNTMCTMVGSIYGTPVTSGHCGEENECKCNISPNATLEDYWSKKFDSKEILQEISAKKDISRRILAELKKPYKTPQQTILAIRPMLSAKQLKNLRVKDNEIQKLFTVDGKFDRSAIRRYVAMQMKSYDRAADAFDHKEILINVLDAAHKDVFDYIFDEVRRSKNKLLNSALDRYAKERNIKKTPPTESANDQETLVDVLDAAVINQLIRSPPRKAPIRDDSVLNLSSSRSRSSKLATRPTTEDLRWKLPGFDPANAAEVKRGRKCWEDSGNYKVCVNKSNYRQALNWNNEKQGISVEMQVLNNQNRVVQQWSFPDNVDVSLIRDAKGLNKQEWSLKNSTWEFSKDSEGRIRQNSWSGPRDMDSIEAYKRNINAWCSHNDFFLGKENCVIY